jgi:hypothetical protein
MDLRSGNANGVGSRFRGTIDHMEGDLSENDSRPPCTTQCRLSLRESTYFRGEAVKKWDWLRAETAKTLENQRSRRCLSQFFHSLGAKDDSVSGAGDERVRTHPR